MTKSRVLLGVVLLAAMAWIWHGIQGLETLAAIRGSGGPGAGGMPAKEERLGDLARDRRDAAEAASQTVAQARVQVRPPALSPRQEEAWRAGLVPRQPLAKETPHSPPGEVHRLIVKFADHLLARATPGGQLLVTAADEKEVSGLTAAADAWSLGFRPVQTVSEQELADLEQRAALRSGRAQPDLGGFVEAVITDPTPQRLMELATQLNGLPEVEFVEISAIDRLPETPASDIPPTSSLLTVNQAYRSGLQGIDVDYAVSHHNAKGHASLKISDCEYAYNPNHEDLSGLITLQPGVQSMSAVSGGSEHGTAVLGILGAAENPYGMTGSATLCPLQFFADQATLTGSVIQTRPACITAALAASAVGDIVMLEMQEYGPNNNNYVPAEYSTTVWSVVKTGTDAGVVVIAAAGNGSEDLDGSLYQSYRNRGDSGAIIVGAGNRKRERLGFSTHGSRVDVQGWGGTVATLAYGDLATYGGDPNQTYTAFFNGTSSATPIVTSAAAVIQGVAIRDQGERLSPSEMRTLLKTTGRPQTGDTSTEIGPLPNLAAAIPQLLGTAPPPVVNDTLRVNGAVGQVFSFQIPATHSPSSYTASGLPAGLLLDASSGVISGTPGAGGSFAVSVSAVNGAGSGSGIIWFDILGDLAAAVEAPQLSFSTGGDAIWINQAGVSKVSGDAAESGDIDDEGESWMQTTVNGPGTLSFWWKVSSEASYDFLRFRLDGNPVAALLDISGSVDWQFKVLPIPAGTHTLRWTYDKDDSSSAFADTGYVDGVEFHPGVAANILVTTLTDENNGSMDASLGNGISLREAIAFGTSNSVIGFHPSLNGKTLTLSTGQISVTRSYTIDASSLADGLRIDGGGTSRIFDIQAGRTETIRNLDFRNGHDAGDGGGIRNSGTASLNDCSFDGCSAGDDGGAIYNGGTLTLTRCALTGNTASDAGGGILNASTKTTTLNDCLLTGNLASDNGGAIASESGSVSLSSCVVSYNQALGPNNGGAIDNDGNGTLTLGNCTFASNSTSSSGGAINNEGTLNATGCTFSNNAASTSLSAGGGGGAIQHIAGTLTVTNCTFSGNSARYGGAIDGDNTSALQLISCTLSGNYASSDGGGIEETDGTLSLTQCIIAGNSAGAQGPDIKGGVDTQTGGNLLSTTAGVTGFTGLVGVPQLSPLGIYGGLTATMPPLPGSPAINAGTSASALSTDQRGLPRTQGAAVDLGAVESGNPLPAVIVNTLADENDGTASGGISLRDALAAAAPGSTITFAPGLVGGTVLLEEGELVMGKNLVIDGSGLPGGMVLRAGEGQRVLTLLPGKSALLKSVIISGGSESRNGGAIWNQGELVLDDCSVADSSTEAYGGGIFNSGYLTLLNTTIARNEALESGGGIYSDKGAVTLSGCTICDNQAWGGHGGGINSQAALTVKQSTFTRNFAYCMGGAIDSSGPLTLDSSTIADNLCSFGSIDNSHADGGGGGVSQHAGAFALNNTIIAGNTDESDLAKDLRGTISSLTGVNLLSSTQGTTGFSGIIAPPLLGPLASNGGPTLTMLPQAGSPALNAGGTTSYTIDQRGLPRVAGGSVDIGAVEAGSNPPVLVVNTALDENDGIGIGGVSLRDAVNAAYPGSQITFAPALNGAALFLASPIDLSKHLSIDASALPDGIEVLGNGGVRIFEVSAARHVTLRSLRLSHGETSTSGGAILNRGDLSIERCRIMESLADQGGAIFNAAGADLEMSDCVVSLCSAVLGGGLCNEGGLSLVRCVFEKNEAEEDGGAVYDSAGLSASQSVFLGNSSGGFAGALRSSAAVTMDACTVADNDSADSGGGLSLSGSAVLKGCTISGNACGGSGGGIVNSAGSLSLKNCTLSGNSAGADYGGGIYTAATLSVESCTISGNDAVSEGGGIYVAAAGQLALANSIVAGNEAQDAGPDIHGAVTSHAGVNLLGDDSGVSSSHGGLVADPQLLPLGSYGGPTLTMPPAPASPAINAGGATSLPSDQRGLSRVVGGSLDIGAVETGNALPVIVVNTVADETDGIAVGNVSLRDALQDAPAGATITFAPGLDAGAIVLTAGSLKLEKNLMLDASGLSNRMSITTAGEHSAIEVAPGVVAAIKNLEIFDLNIDHSGALLNEGKLALENCRFSGNSTADGGGVANTGELTMSDCLIEDNQAWARGGGLYNTGTASLARCQITGNGTSNNGGGIYSKGPLHLVDTTVSGNGSNASGGGLSSSNTAVIERCTISGNATEGGDGAGIYNTGSMEIFSSTLAGNLADADSEGVGGAIANGSAGHVFLHECTVSANTAEAGGPGIWNSATGTLGLRNTIVAGNTSSDIKGAISVNSGVNLVSSTAGITGSFAGVVAQPHLAPLGNYGGLTKVMPPLPGSAAIDAASSGGPNTDQCGRPRPNGPLPDIGAVEAVAFSSLGLADADGDGIPDLLEPGLGLVVGHNDAAADSDHDGVSDAAELADMSDPTDARSFLHIISITPAPGFNLATNPVFTVQFPSFPGLVYRVEAEQHLQFIPGGDVRELVPAFTATGHTVSVEVLLRPGKDFVRVVRE